MDTTSMCCRQHVSEFDWFMCRFLLQSPQCTPGPCLLFRLDAPSRFGVAAAKPEQGMVVDENSPIKEHKRQWWRRKDGKTANQLSPALALTKMIPSRFPGCLWPCDMALASLAPLTATNRFLGEPGHRSPTCHAPDIASLPEGEVNKEVLQPPAPHSLEVQLAN